MPLIPARSSSRRSRIRWSIGEAAPRSRGRVTSPSLRAAPDVREQAVIRVQHVADTAPLAAREGPARGEEVEAMFTSSVAGEAPNGAWRSESSRQGEFLETR